MNISVLGDGAFGTAIAELLAQNGHKVTLWCYNQEVADCIKKNKTNNIFLKNITLSELIEPTISLKDACQNDILCIAIPVAFIRQVLSETKEFATNKQFIIFSKGIENKSLQLPSQIVQEVLPNNNVALISGPSFAHDIAKKQPTAVNFACENFKDYNNLKTIFDNNFFKTYYSQDIIGTQLQGAIKNVFAIGVGILEGLGYSENSKIWFLMNCLEENKTLTKALGGNPETIYSFAGIGDLMLTCLGSKSKNVAFGLSIAQRKKADAKSPQVPEGLNTVVSVKELCSKYSLNLPICSGIYDILFNNLEPESLVTLLLNQ